MLKTNFFHPEIFSALGASGHGSRVLIADGNYPFSTGSNPGAKKVCLNLRPEPEIQSEMRKMLPAGVPRERKWRLHFYEEAKSPDTALVIATGEQRIYANILLVIGVVKPA